MSKYQSPKVSVNNGAAKGVVIAIVILIIVGVVVTASVKIVDSGNRGVLLHCNAVDLTQPPLEEGSFCSSFPR